jgi:hypothetical protein
MKICYAGNEHSLVQNYFPPYGYKEYINSLKKLGKSLAEGPNENGNYNAPGLDQINIFAKSNPSLFKNEGSRETRVDNDRVTLKNIRLNHFIDEFNIAGRNVEYYPPRNKEGGVSSNPEGN